MGVLGEDEEEVAFAHNEVGAGAVGVAGNVLVGVVGDALLNLGKGLATHEFGAHNAELDIGKAPVRLVAFFVHKTGGIFADYHFHAVVQEVCAVLYLGRHLGDVIQCCIYGRGKAFVQANVFDVVKYHSSLFEISRLRSK